MEKCSCAKVTPSQSPIFRKRKPSAPWEENCGQTVAVILAALDGKRFFLLSLEAIAEMQIIQFSGGINPMILSFVDAGLGLPSALFASYGIHKRKVWPCYSRVKILLQCAVLIIVICIILNVTTLTSIGYYINVQTNANARIFNETMHLYVKNDKYKYTIDRLQFELQCCGYSKYTDWFLIHWQEIVINGMSNRGKISDQKAISNSVPFSCCKLQTTISCHHTGMLEQDVYSINVYGCAKVLSSVMKRIVISGYVITSLILLIQIYFIYLLRKIIKIPSPEECPSNCTCLISRYGAVGPLHDSSSTSYPNSSATESILSDNSTSSDSLGRLVCHRATYRKEHLMNHSTPPKEIFNTNDCNSENKINVSLVQQ